MIGLSVLLCLKALPCQALEGVPYIDFVIHGKTWHVPIPNKEVKQDFYFLQKSLHGDNDAREMLLNGKDKRYLFIGDLTPIWCVITKSDITVEIPRS